MFANGFEFNFKFWVREMVTGGHGRNGIPVGEEAMPKHFDFVLSLVKANREMILDWTRYILDVKRFMETNQG